MQREKYSLLLIRGNNSREINRELSKYSISREQFEYDINFIKKKGYSFVKSTIIPGINAIAAPIFNRSSSLIAVLTVVGLENSLDTAEHSKAVQILKEKSVLLSRLLGWNGHFLTKADPKKVVFLTTFWHLFYFFNPCSHSRQFSHFRCLHILLILYRELHYF